MPMSTSVKFFSSAMPNAPQLSAANGSLISVLDACLVNGWNSTTAASVAVSAGVATATFASAHPFQKWQVILVAGATPSGLNGEARITAVTANTLSWAVTGVADGTATGTITVKTAPLGWLKAHTGTHKAAYKIDGAAHPEAPACLVRFDDSFTYGAKVAGYESMSSVDDGVNPFPTSGQNPNGLWVLKTESSSTSAFRSWYVVGDGKLFYIGVNNSNDIALSSGPTWSAFGQYANNAIDAFAFIVTGANNNESAGSSASQHQIFYTQARNEYQFAARSYDGLSLSVSFEIRSWPSQYGSSGGPGAPLAYPNGPNNGLYLCPADIIEASASGFQHRGALPGSYMLPHNLMGRILPDKNTVLMDDTIAGFEGRIIGFYPVVYTTGNNQRTVVAFDLTGPWER